MTVKEAAAVLGSIPEPCRLLRVRDAALATGMHRDTIYNRIRSGQVRAWGSPRRVLLDDLLRPYIPEATKTS